MHPRKSLYISICRLYQHGSDTRNPRCLRSLVSARWTQKSLNYDVGFVEDDCRCHEDKSAEISCDSSDVADPWVSEE